MECRHKFTMCRLCLCESESFIDIFRVNECFGYVAADVIAELLQLQVSDKDVYPHVVCSICLGKLTDFKQFKQQCQDSRDTYDNVFASDESYDEHPIDIVELLPVKLESKDPLDTQETQEVRKSGVAFTSLECSARRRKRTRREAYGPRDDTESAINYDGEPSLKRGEKAAVGADPSENIKSSGSAGVKVGETDVKASSGCKSLGERMNVLPVEESDVNRVESGVGDLRRGRIERREDVDCVDGARRAGSEAKGGSEGGHEAALGANRKYFRCNDCGKDFEKRDVFVRHLELHGYEINGESSGKQVNTNIGCGSKRKTGDSLEEGLTTRRVSGDVKNHEGVKKYVCDYCGQGFNWIYTLKTHLRAHNGERPFACTVCGKRFSEKSYLRIHKLTHAVESTYACETCGMQFTEISSLVSHRRFHSAEKPYACQVCGLRFSRNAYLLRHGGVHNGEKPYVCDVCGLRLARKDYLTSHMRVHSVERPYACETCGKRCVLKSGLRKHMQTHNGEKPYKCETCGLRFAQKAFLSRHGGVHSDEKPFVCEVCGIRVSRKDNLASHMRVHSGEKPYVCEMCGIRFARKDNLTTHMRVHRGDKPYVCKICGKRSGQKCDLTKHMLIHNSGENSA